MKPSKNVEDDENIFFVELFSKEGKPDRLDKALSYSIPAQMALSRTRLARMISQGSVFIDGVAITNPKTKVMPGAVAVLHLDPPEEVDIKPENIALDVYYEDDELIVINKPAGMVVHPAPGSPRGTLVNAIMYYCGEHLSGVGGQRRPGIVHRIDKETSGLLVVTKSDRAHHSLAEQFANHSVARRYLAIAHGVPSAADPRLRGLRGVTFESGGIVKVATFLARHKTDRQRQAVFLDAGRHAVTRFRVLRSFAGQASLVECWLETGRTHQIRVHLSYAGHGLLGDQTYGGKQRLSSKAIGDQAANAGNGFQRQALHAASLGFNHPVTDERLEFFCEPPKDFSKLQSLLEQATNTKVPYE